MQLYNPTKQDIYQDYCLRNYKIPAGSIVEAYQEVADHLIRKCAVYGLVGLSYGTEEENKFGSYEEYKKSKAIEGLKRKIEFLDECMRQEAYGIKESIEKNASPNIDMSFKVEEFKRQIEVQKEHLEEISKPVEVTEELQVKKLGRPFKKVEKEENQLNA